MNTFSMAFLLMGFLFLFLTLVIHITNKDKKNKFLKYCHTTGTITSSAFNGYNYNRGKNKNSYNKGKSFYGMTHRIYEYEVDGKKYSRADESAVINDVFNKELGKTVDVYYDKENPNKSFIDIPKRNDEMKVLLITFLSLSSFFLMIGLVLLFL